MTKTRQTFHKRQREMKRREKAQIKRQRREQRRKDKDAPQTPVPAWLSEPDAPTGEEPVAGDEQQAGDPLAQERE